MGRQMLVAKPAYRRSKILGVKPVLTSRQNARVRALRAALAARRAAETIAVESPHLLREALATPGIEVLTVFAREDRAHLLDELPAHVESVLLTEDVFESISATEHSQGVVALVRRPELRHAVQRGDLLLILDGVQDPGNVGALVRSAEAFGAAAVLVTEGCADVWNGKALRASAGACFRMPVLQWSESLQASLGRCGIRLLAAVPEQQGAVPVTETVLTGGCALLIGSEGRGISDAMLVLADGRMTLPMLGRTESLNAAVAGSVLLYEAARQRAAADVQRKQSAPCGDLA